MFLNDISKIERIIERSQFSIFSFLPSYDYSTITIPRAFVIQPTSKTTIGIEEVRPIRDLIRTKQASLQPIIIYQADTLTEAAQNALLKLLEEPNDNVSYAFFVYNPTALLPTVLSRALLYHIRSTTNISSINEAILDQAKKLISTNIDDLINLSSVLTKNRQRALSVVDEAINLSYESYFSTKDHKFLAKLSNLVTLRDNISANGHIRLHIVANMA
jgi:DNA polymerase III gamma/tau subunit